MLPNTMLQYYCSMHTLSPNIQIKPRMLLYTCRSSHTFSHTHTISLTHTEQGTHLPPTHTRQIIQPPHTYRAKHTNSTHMQSKAYIFHPHTEQGTQSSTYPLIRAYGQLRGFSHKHSATNMLAKTYHYPQTLVTKVTRQGTHSATDIFPRILSCQIGSPCTCTGLWRDVVIQEHNSTDTTAKPPAMADRTISITTADYPQAAE